MRRITYVIINKKSSRGMKKMFRKTSGIRVYESEKEGTWKKLKGLKDDFLIYDRCGLLAYHLDHSVTYLGWPIVRYCCVLIVENFIVLHNHSMFFLW